MSDSDKTTAASGSSPQFTERELQLLGWAMQSLKSGPPEIDYDKLAGYAGMGNPRSAANAWAKIKLKLMSPVPDGIPPATPKKAPRSRKPAATKSEGEEGDVAATPKKTPRKRGNAEQGIDGEASPKKKPARGKKTSGDQAVKAEPEAEPEDLKPDGSPMKIDPAEAAGEIEQNEV